MGAVRTAIDTLRAFWWLARISVSARLGMGSRRRIRERHMLLLAWYLPPIASGGMFRPFSFLRYAPKSDWSATAIGGDAPNLVTEGAKEHLVHLPETSEIDFIQTPSLKPSWRAFPRVNGGFLEALETVGHARRLFGTDRPAVVVASGPPFHNFLAARWLARYFAVPLVLDYRDEWTETPFEFVKLGTADRDWEKRCIAAADRVVFTTDSQRKHGISAFAELAEDRAVVIPNGWEPSDSGPPSNPTGGDTKADTPSDDRCVISFIGSLGDHTPPHGFLETAARVFEKRADLPAQFRFLFVGRRSDAANHALKKFPYPNVLDIRDLVAKSEAVSLTERSSALVLFARPALERYIPGKLYDYLGAKRPILIFGHPGEASDIVEKTGAGVCLAEGDVVGLEAFFERLLQGVPDVPETASEWVQERTREALARRFFALLDEL